jgi:hypothetical protein
MRSGEVFLAAMRGGCDTGGTMGGISQQRRTGTAVQIALAIGLLFVLMSALLLAQGVGDHSMAPVVFLLVPIFLFGTIDPAWSLRVVDWLDAATIRPTPVRAALFGRPPPSELF